MLENCFDEMFNSIAIVEEINHSKFEFIFYNKRFLRLFFPNNNWMSKKSAKIKFEKFCEKMRSNFKSLQSQKSKFKSLKFASKNFPNENPLKSMDKILQDFNSTDKNKISLKFENFDEAKLDTVDFKMKITKHVLNKKIFIIHIKSLRKKFENERIKEYKSRLLTSFSHELKTPLNGTLTFLELLNVEEEEQKKYLENSLCSLRILENTLNNIIDMSLFDSDEFMINMSDVNLQNYSKKFLKY